MSLILIGVIGIIVLRVSAKRFWYPNIMGDQDVIGIVGGIWGGGGGGVIRCLFVRVLFIFFHMLHNRTIINKYNQ